MGKIINVDFNECLKRNKLTKFTKAKSLVSKEISSAKSDMETAFDSFKRENYKWATVQAYYAMFHTARALLYSKGFREKSHYCLIVAMKTLFVSEKILDIRLVEALQTAKILRENADYDSDFSKSSAEALVEKAKDFLKEAEKILNYRSKS